MDTSDTSVVTVSLDCEIKKYAETAYFLTPILFYTLGGLPKRKIVIRARGPAFG